MLGSDGPLVIGGLVVVGLAALVVAAAIWSAWRTLRRRYRALHGHPAVRTAAALWSLARSAPPTGVPVGRLRWPGSRPTALARRQLWRSVGAAERAVHEASAAGGSVGELPGLVRRLRDVAADVDRVLAMGDGIDARSPALDVARRHAAEIVDASSAIRLTAIAAAGDATRTRVASLAADADREVRSLAEGLARARTAFPARRGA